MASPLRFKVYSATEMVASVRYAEDAARIVPDDGYVTWEGRKVWREGREEDLAGNSFDFAAGVMWDRVAAIQQRAYARNLARVGVAS